MSVEAWRPNINVQILWRIHLNWDKILILRQYDLLGFLKTPVESANGIWAYDLNSTDSSLFNRANRVAVSLLQSLYYESSFKWTGSS